MTTFKHLVETQENKVNSKELTTFTKHDQIFECLNDIRFGLINGELLEEHILNLKNTLQSNRLQFKFLELQGVMDDIILHSKMALARIEANKKVLEDKK